MPGFFLFNAATGLAELVSIGPSAPAGLLTSIAASGAMDEKTLLAILARLPPGITEIYLHPATVSGSAIAASMSGYRHADELAALLSPRVRAAAAAAGIRHGGYVDALRAREAARE